MRLSSSLVVPSVAAALSTVLLCAPAASQIPKAPPPRFPPSRSMRRSRWQSRTCRSGEQPQRRHAGRRHPLERQPPVHLPMRRAHRWRGLPAWRKSPAAATVAVHQASGMAMSPGLAAASRAAISIMDRSRQRAGTPSRMHPTRIAWRRRCSWARIETEPTGSAAASPPATGSRLPTSSGQDIVSSNGHTNTPLLSRTRSSAIALLRSVRRGPLDCFAALAMTDVADVWGHSRPGYARAAASEM